MSTLVRVSSASIYDGTGAEPFSGHVLIDRDVIKGVIATGPAGQAPSPMANVPALIELAEDAIVTPGFVDLHSHSDLSLVACPNAPSKAAQAVTTEVVGNCGFSAFPDPEYWLEPKSKYRHGAMSWQSASAYFAELESTPPASNVATLVGAGSVRAAVLGSQADSRADRGQINAMRTLIAEAVDQGALGISTGLFYPPGCFASTEELVELLRPLGQAPLLHATHLREESRALVDSVHEAIGISRGADARLHISHLKAKGRSSWGAIDAAVKAIEDADQQVTVDVYPYEATMTRIDTLIPREHYAAAMDGGANGTHRHQIVDALEQAVIDSDGDDAWRRIVIASLPREKHLERHTIEDAATELGVSPGEAVLTLARASNGQAEIINHCLSQSDVDQVVTLPYAAVASDGYALPLDAFGGLPHPRSFGTFPRFLRRYALELKTLTLQEAIRKITSLPADIVGCSQLGRLHAGCWADLAVIDPNRLRDRADYDSPAQLPAGIDAVVIGGCPIDVGTSGVARPRGRVLR